MLITKTNLVFDDEGFVVTSKNTMQIFSVLRISRQRAEIQYINSWPQLYSDDHVTKQPREKRRGREGGRGWGGAPPLPPSSTLAVDTLIEVLYLLVFL